MDDFFYEIKIMSTLDHKNILKFLGVSITSSGDVFLITEYMEHGSVKDLIEKTGGDIDFKLKVRRSYGYRYIYGYRYGYSPLNAIFYSNTIDKVGMRCSPWNGIPSYL